MMIQESDGMAVLASMATPAVLLMANAMLILSTIQRLQAILARVRETELTIAGADTVRETSDTALLHDLLTSHASRARSAHRALLCFYGSAGLFTLTVVALGLTTLGIAGGRTMALIAAFGGCALLFGGAALLVHETWIGIRATDRRFQSVMDLCRILTLQRPPKPSEPGAGGPPGTVHASGVRAEP